MTRRLIGYSKLGRSLTLKGNAGFQGNLEATNLLFRLAARNPEVDWLIVGKRTKYDGPLPSNIIDPWNPADIWDTGRVIEWADRIDGNVVHLGQHGTSHQSIPFVNLTWAETREGGQGRTRPLETQKNYGQHIIKILNAVGDRTDGKAPVSWVCTDPRNFFKGRDLKWPTGLDRILAQGNQSKNGFHERFLDPRLPGELGFNATAERGGEIWKFQQVYRHAGLELMIIPDNWQEYGDTDFYDRSDFGIMTTSAFVEKRELRRSALLKEYIGDRYPKLEVFGSWDEKSLEEVKPLKVIQNDPTDFHKLLESYRCTVALPAPARQLGDIFWTTSKPNQAFMTGTVCFFLGDLDRAGWMIPNTKPSDGATAVGDDLYSIRQDWSPEELHLAKWLRVTSPDDLEKKVKAVTTSVETWEWLTGVQHRLLRRRISETYTERIIEHQLGITK